MSLPILNNAGFVSDLLAALPQPSAAERAAVRPLPMSRAEMEARGWDAVDVVFISGDAYIDHPSFAAAVLGRVLEAAGFRVGIVAQPDWRSAEPWREFGRPRLCFAISSGNMDSMINHYTASRKVRNSDAYSPGGRIGKRPDRATLSYCQRAREAFPGVPVIAGGVEASLRRIAHYDYWSDQVRKSILLDSKADLVVFGMGEEAILEIAQHLKAGRNVRDLRRLRGVAYCLGASEPVPTDALELPSYEQVLADKLAFSEATRMLHHETNPYNARKLIQRHGNQTVVQNPPRFPISQGGMDAIYGLAYTREPHPRYSEPIPAHQMIKDSVTIMRGCFGGCTFCSITAHQGRIIQSRSPESVLAELGRIGADPSFKGTVSDIGGPTANMYQMRCTEPAVEAKCRRQSCVHPKVCKLLGTDHGPLLDLMRAARAVPGVKKTRVSSGIRMDLARLSPEYIEELSTHHVGGQLKVAPEAVNTGVLNYMRKPAHHTFEEFAEQFNAASKAAGKKQYLVPYFIASHPGSDVHAMIELAVFLKRNGYKPDQVQDFIPSPMDVATSMYWTGLDPFTKKPVLIAKQLRDRRFQRALLQYFKPENWFEVRAALLEAGRQDLIGDGCDSLISSRPPKEALARRQADANRRFNADHYHAKDAGVGPAAAKKSRNTPGTGYRPERKSTKRRPPLPGNEGKEPQA